MTHTQNPGFWITQGRGFQVKFANGWGISVQFGRGNYCANGNKRPPIGNDYLEHEQTLGETGCVDAEIAILTPAGELLDVPEWGDSVNGYVTPDQVAHYMHLISSIEKDGSLNITPELRPLLGLEEEDQE